ncbi:preprotein translocase subunit SecD [Sphingomonas laterariae]|uniref:Protein translocase subunit SecD n=1 Tax=Edaphosphingomonas laterariae TaxID=861865 RepID=A0A239EFC6_9SPHN|nr:protein translocase subunit SecD [Sphingomonas laterariae]SNS42614.1 preprotein translocase subunit SecD [Sphingomonas laterariae]
MLDFPRWKVWTIVTTVVVGILLSIPSLIPEATLARAGLAGLPRINLGLDLAGGSHILLEADTADVAKQRLQLMEENVRTEMRRGDTRIEIGDISTAGGKLSFFVRDTTKLDTAVERIRTLTQPAGMTGQRDWDVAVVDSTRIVLTPTKSGLDTAVNDAMDVATDVVRRRIDEMGTREPTIIRQGSERIVVQVPGLQNPEALKSLLGKTAKLEFKLVDLTVSPADIAANRAPPGSQILPYPDNPGGVPAIAVYRRVMVSGDELIDAKQSFDQQGRPVTSIAFNNSGGRKFGRVTTENVGKPFAMILDGKVISAPNINEPILGGQAQISGNFTVQTANELAIALKSGKLPVALKVVEERTVGPDLGADSIRSGTIAAIIATVAVVVFMLVTYGRFGVYANIALVINILMVLGVMALAGATLTLPGIAGFVLTIGAAVDANVLINERIREEQRRGRNVIQSIELGYKEASRAIFDANITNTIAAVIMFMLGTGPVKGFAVVLIIGIATSVFTAVTLTRLMVSRWLRTKRPQTITI